MNYSKPQLTEIGTARTVIGNPIAKDTVVAEQHGGNPAYDLDE
jgi:hypothetical protein